MSHQLTLDAILLEQRETNRLLEQTADSINALLAELTQLNEQLADQRQISDEHGREVPAAVDRLAETIATAAGLWSARPARLQ